MALYQDLYNAQLVTLEQQIIVALAIKANTIAKLASPTAAQKAFAIAALRDPKAYLPTLKNYILAEYNTATVAVLAAATDAQVQTAVNAAVDTLLGV